MNPLADPVAIPPVFDLSTVISLLVGVFLPWAIAKLQSWEASPQFRAWFAFGVCLLVGLLTTYLTKSFTGHWSGDMAANVYLIVLNMVTVTTSAWQTYARLWTNTTAFQRINLAPDGVGKP